MVKAGTFAIINDRRAESQARPTFLAIWLGDTAFQALPGFARASSKHHTKVGPFGFASKLQQHVVYRASQTGPRFNLEVPTCCHDVLSKPPQRPRATQPLRCVFDIVSETRAEQEVS